MSTIMNVLLPIRCAVRKLPTPVVAAYGRNDEQGVMTKTAVVALGGNAFTRTGRPGTYEEKARNAADMATAVKKILDSGWRVVIVHGNGPQIGNLALQQEATDLVPAQPLDLLGAMTQGELGSLIVRAVGALHGSDRVVSVITHTIVDGDDPAFGDPTKPIGPFLTRHEATEVAAERGWTMREDAGRGYRRMVPSPEPVGLLELSAGGYTGVDAVIDKDHAACLLATALPAQALLLVTAVETLFLDYGTDRQRPLHRVSSEQAGRYLDEHQFPPGSMGPKVSAALRFLREGGELAVITTPESLAATLADPVAPKGTRIESSNVELPR